MTTYGLLIDYEYCTGCQVCEVACKEEHDFGVGKWGIRVLDDGPGKKSTMTIRAIVSTGIILLSPRISAMAAKIVLDGREIQCAFTIVKRTSCNLEQLRKWQ